MRRRTNAAYFFVLFSHSLVSILYVRITSNAQVYLLKFILDTMSFFMFLFLFQLPNLSNTSIHQVLSFFFNNRKKRVFFI